MNRCLVLLREGKPARLVEIAPEEREAVRRARAAVVQAGALCLQCRGSARPTRAMRFSDKVAARAAEEGAVAVVVSAKIESEIAVMPADEQKDFLEAVGLDEPGLNRVIRAGYDLLHLITYFTVGPKEARAWTIEQGHHGARGGGRHPHRFREGLHPRRDHRL